GLVAELAHARQRRARPGEGARAGCAGLRRMADGSAHPRGRSVRDAMNEQSSKCNHENTKPRRKCLENLLRVFVAYCTKADNTKAEIILHKFRSGIRAVHCSFRPRIPLPSLLK